jgi:hypothetical protein
MTLARMKENAMNVTPKPEQQARYEAEKKRRAEFELSINRKMNNLLGGWRRCGHRSCRRAHQCVGLPLKCHVKRKPRPPLTPEQRSRASHSLRIALDKRRAELAAGAKPMSLEEFKQLCREKKCAAKGRKRERLAAGTATPAVIAPSSRGADAPATAREVPRPLPQVKEEPAPASPAHAAALPGDSRESPRPGARVRSL